MHRAVPPALLLLSLLAASCGEQAEPAATNPPGEPDTGGHLFSAASWQLAWTHQAATANADGTFTLKTNLGYTVTIKRGFLISYSAAFALCDGLFAPEATRHEPLLLRALDALTFTRRAFAGHTEGQDPSFVAGPLAEPIGASTLLLLGARTFPEADYCRLHYVVGNSGAAVAGAPDDLDLTRSSLYIELTWSDEVHAEPTPLLLHSTVANGALLNVRDLLPPDADPQATQATITVTRDLDSLFDDIDLASSTADEDDLSRAVLRNVIQHATFELNVRRGQGP